MNPAWTTLRLGGLALIICVAVGCRTGPPAATPVGNPAVAVRNNAASLLYELMGDERNVSKLLLIKRESPELETLVKTISSVCAGAYKRLEGLAQADPTLNLKSTDLPPGEHALRKAESKSRASLLLRSSGADFQFHLLFSQAQALGYAEQLASVAAQDKSVPATAQALANLSQQMKILNQQVIAMVRSAPPAPK